MQHQLEAVRRKSQRIIDKLRVKVLATQAWNRQSEEDNDGVQQKQALQLLQQKIELKDMQITEMRNKLRAKTQSADRQASKVREMACLRAELQDTKQKLIAQQHQQRVSNASERALVAKMQGLECEMKDITQRYVRMNHELMEENDRFKQNNAEHAIKCELHHEQTHRMERQIQTMREEYMELSKDGEHHKEKARRLEAALRSQQAEHETERVNDSLHLKEAWMKRNRDQMRRLHVKMKAQQTEHMRVTGFLKREIQECVGALHASKDKIKTQSVAVTNVLGALEEFIIEKFAHSQEFDAMMRHLNLIKTTTDCRVSVYKGTM